VISRGGLKEIYGTAQLARWAAKGTMDIGGVKAGGRRRAFERIHLSKSDRHGGRTGPLQYKKRTGGARQSLKAYWAGKRLKIVD